MKLLNSPIYKPTQEISSLKRALVYLGLRQIREIALTTSVITAFEGKSGALKLNSFWEHSFGVGMVSKIIAQKVGYKDLEKAYISGILHKLLFSYDGVIFLYMLNGIMVALDMAVYARNRRMENNRENLAL